MSFNGPASVSFYHQSDKRPYIVTGGFIYDTNVETKTIIPVWITTNQVLELFKVKPKQCYLIYELKDIIGLKEPKLWLFPNILGHYGPEFIPKHRTEIGVIEKFVREMLEQKDRLTKEKTHAT